jgi:hypothetical protein
MWIHLITFVFTYGRSKCYGMLLRIDRYTVTDVSRERLALITSVQYFKCNTTEVLNLQEDRCENLKYLVTCWGLSFL